jgi:cholesterol transport system auxiliary component
MKKALYILSALLMMACSTPLVQEPLQYDFGSLRATSSATTLPPLSIAEVSTPAWLDTNRMIYRLAYANDQQLRAYAHSRWTMPPSRLFEQRLKARIAQAGGAVLSENDGAYNLLQVKLDADDFSHVFSSPTQSGAHVAVRVSVLRGRILLAQKTFVRQSPAPTADAGGGAAAMADASDAVIADVIAWLAGQTLK